MITGCIGGNAGGNIDSIINKRYNAGEHGCDQPVSVTAAESGRSWPGWCMRCTCMRWTLEAAVVWGLCSKNAWKWINNQIVGS